MKKFIAIALIMLAFTGCKDAKKTDTKKATDAAKKKADEAAKKKKDGK